MKKKKRINPIEAHLEKLVLGVVSLVLLAVVAMQFLTQPNAVQLGNTSGPVDPDQIYKSTVEDARRLLAQMNDATPPQIELPEQSLGDAVVGLTDLPVAEEIRVAQIAGDAPSIASAVETDGAAGDAATTYVMPALPIPATIAAASHRATLDPVVWATNEEIRAYVAPAQPFDLAAVSIEGTVDASALRESLENDPDGDGPSRPLPLSWWRGGIDLLGVEAQREELSSGGWTNPTVVAGVPGRSSLLVDARQGELTPVDLQNLANEAGERMRDIAQPDFPRQIAGDAWVRPSERVEDADLTEEDLEIRRLERRLEDVDERTGRVREQLEELGGSGGGGIESRGNERGNPGRRGQEGGGGGGGQDTRQRNLDQQRQRQEALLNSLLQQRDRIVDQLADLGVSVDEEPEDNARDPEPEALPELLAADSLPVWVHDVTAEPGKTYRYRMRLVINNPLFGRGLYLADAQKGVADSPVLEGEWSPWSQPVDMESDQHYFVTSASDDDALGSGPRAAVEVYEFYYGFWRKGSATLEPGDLIQASAKLPDSLLIWDPAKLDEMARQGVRPGARPGPGGRELEAMPGEERRRMIEGGGEGRYETPRGRNEPSAEPELPPGAEPGPKALTMSVNALLLDVARIPGEDNIFQAVLRGSDGSLIMQRADRDRGSSLYRRLASSARAGENQGQPEPDPTDQEQPRPFERNPNRYPDEELPGGPGGG